MVTTMSTIKNYSELSRLTTFIERYRYLKLSGQVGRETFGFDRYLNQIFYNSDRWKEIRNYVIIRDNGCDLGAEDFDINERIIIHHMNPITLRDIEHETDYLTDPEFLICTTLGTHNAIHYGDERLLRLIPIERTKYDTCPWKRG